jgi:predicted transcriptional regulator
MKRLSEKEEALMNIVWRFERAFAKEVREALPDPKPHINTVATTLRRLADKGFLQYEDFGSTYRYSALVSRKEYTNRFVKPCFRDCSATPSKTWWPFLRKRKKFLPKN